MKRQIVLDTETTGLKPEEGHRLLEIGAVELIDGVKTGNVFHHYVYPQRSIPQEVIAIHGIDDKKVKDCPTFGQIADDFINFVKDSELIIHNADFDVKFLNSELSKFDKGRLWDHVKNTICTLKLSKMLYAKEKGGNKLDKLCERLGVDNSHRTLHGALLDADLLADVYIAMRKQHPLEDIEADFEQVNWKRPEIKRLNGLKFKRITLTPQEQESHEAFLAAMQKKDKVEPLFMSQDTKRMKP